MREAFAIPQPQLREHHTLLAVFEAHREVVGILFDLRREWHAEKDMWVKLVTEQHRTVIQVVLAVHLMPDIHAHTAPPNFALLERGRMVLGVQLFLLTVPAWEVLLHRTCM